MKSIAIKIAAFLACVTALTFIQRAYGTVEISPITGGFVGTLTDGAEIAWQANQGYSYQVTIAGNRLMLNPSDMTIGARYTLLVIQDGTGGRSLTWGSAYRFPSAQFADSPSPVSDRAIVPTLSSAPGSHTILEFWSDGTHLSLVATSKDIQGAVTSPSLLTASDDVSGQVNLTWSDNSSDETGFEIWRANSEAVIHLLTTVAANAESYSDTGGDPDPGLAYYVRAVRNFERSDFSNYAIGFELP